MRCSTLFCSSWDYSVVSVVAMGRCSFAVTGDHGFVTLANAGDRRSAGQLGNSDDGNLHEARDLGKFYLQVCFFSSGLCLISFMSPFPFHSDSQEAHNLSLRFEAIKAFSAVLGKSTYEQWLYLPEKWFLGKPLLCSKEREEKHAVH